MINSNKHDSSNSFTNSDKHDIANSLISSTICTDSLSTITIRNVSSYQCALLQWNDPTLSAPMPSAPSLHTLQVCTDSLNSITVCTDSLRTVANCTDSLSTMIICTDSFCTNVNCSYAIYMILGAEFWCSWVENRW